MVGIPITHRRRPAMETRKIFFVFLKRFAHYLRVAGIGPALPAWEAGVLPLNYTRLFKFNPPTIQRSNQ